MNMEDEFYLGDSTEEESFFLGNPDENYYLGNEETNKSNIIENSQFLNDKAYKELVDVYDLLKIQEKPYKVDFEEYFKNIPEIFKVADTDYFTPLTEKQYIVFEDKCDKLIATAHKKWINIENQKKLEDLQAALNTLKTIFRQPAKTEDYIKEIKRTLREHLTISLKQKIKDGILEVTELLELIEIAISIHLIPDSDKGRMAFLKSIENFNKNNVFKIEKFEETFIRHISKKEKIERINTENVRLNLFKEYKSLWEISSRVYPNNSIYTDEELFEEMIQLLSDNNLLISNTELFMLDFLDEEIKKKGDFYFSVPLNNDYYYYLKGTAINKYELTEDQWRQITMIRNIRNESDLTIAFIMGYKKESSVLGITKLLEENPESSCSRILAGDLETYFSHIGRNNISIKIAKLKQEYKSNSNELVSNVVNLLKNEIGDDIVEKTASKLEENSIDFLIKQEANIKELVSFVVRHKTEESLYNELIKDSLVVERLQSLLLSSNKKYTYLKFLLNILNELIFETDITQYKFAFTKIAIRIQDLLLEGNDYITFMSVFVPIIHKAIDERIISSSNEIDNYSNLYNEMEEKFNYEYEQVGLKNSKKSKFSLFKKKE